MAKKQYKPQVTPEPPMPEPTPAPVDAPATQHEPEVIQHEPDDTLIKIRLLRTFQGRLTHEQRIEPGVYAYDDPALFGLADYLLSTGHAQLVTE